MIGRRRGAWSEDEPSLDDLFAEPIIALLMKRDGVDHHRLRIALDRLSRHLAARLTTERGMAQRRSDEPSATWCGELCLDPPRHQCTWKGHDVRLTVTEFTLMEALVERPGYVKTRDQLMDAAYGKGVAVYDRTIDSHMKRLRGKFKAIDKNFAQIQTIWGVGYRFSTRLRTIARPGAERPKRK